MNQNDSVDEILFRYGTEVSAPYGADYSVYLSSNQPTKQEEPSLTWADHGRSIMMGGASVAEGMGFLAKRLGFEDSGQFIQDLGSRAVEYWFEGLSDHAKESLSKEFVTRDEQGDLAWGDAGWDTVKLMMGQSALGTTAGMGIGGALVKGFQLVPNLSTKVAGALGYGIGEGTIAAGQSGAHVERQIDAMSHEQLLAHPEYQAAFDELGDAGQAKRLVRDAAAGQASAMAGLSTMVLSAPFGAVMGKAFQGVPLATNRARSIATGATAEAGQEFLQSGAEQMAQNKAIQDYADQGRGLFSGVLNAAIGGAAAGGILGGTIGTVTPVQQVQTNADQARSDVAEQGGDALDQAEAASQVALATGQQIEDETRLALPAPEPVITIPDDRRFTPNGLDGQPTRMGRTDLGIQDSHDQFRQELAERHAVQQPSMPSAEPAPNQHEISTDPVPEQHPISTESVPIQHQHQTRTDLAPEQHQVIETDPARSRLDVDPVPAPNQHQTGTESAPIQHETSTKPAPNQHQESSPAKAKLRNWKAPVDPQQDDLLTAIIKQGALSHAELSQDGFDATELKKTKVGHRRVFTAKGRSVNELTESLAQEGYLEQADPQELKTKLRQAMQGESLYSRRREQQAPAIDQTQEHPSVSQPVPEQPDRPIRQQVLENEEQNLPVFDYHEIDNQEFDTELNLSEDEKVMIEALFSAREAGIAKHITDEISEQHPDPRKFAAAIYREIANRQQPASKEEQTPSNEQEKINKPSEAPVTPESEAQASTETQSVKEETENESPAESQTATAPESTESGSGTPTPKETTEPTEIPDQEHEASTESVATSPQEESKDATEPNNETTQEQAKPKAQSNSTIKDVGEVVWGAAKHRWQAYQKRLTDDVDIGGQPLSKSFPEPDYVKLHEDGVEARTVAAIALLRSTLPARPKRLIKHRWVETVKQRRLLVNDLLDGKATVEAAIKSLDFANANALLDLLTRLPPKHVKKAAKWRIMAGTYIQFNGKQLDKPTVVHTLTNDKGRQVSDLHDQDLNTFLEKAETYLKNQLADVAESPKKRASLHVFQDRFTKEYFIGYQGGNRQIARLATGFENGKAARLHLEEHREQLEEKLRSLREVVSRPSKNAPRKAKQWREGDVTIEQFQSDFGFRSAQWGNSLLSAQKEAQQKLNSAYDALMDLAELLGIPPKAVSLDGSLAIAFGARGRGGARAPMAHYEPGQMIINLTRRNGAGTVAHEWFHALDNYLGKQDQSGQENIRQSSDEYGTNRKRKAFIGHRRANDDDYHGRTAVYEALQTLHQSLQQNNFAKRAHQLDAVRSKPYWGTTVEKAARAFEKYAHSRLTQAESSNDFLVNFNQESDAYPSDQEMKQDGIQAAFDQLFNTLDVKQTERGIALFNLSRLENSPDSIGEKSVPLEEAEKAVQRITERWARPETVKLIESFHELPQPIQDGAIDAGVEESEIKGVYFQGRIYLVRQNLHDALDLEETLFHEGHGHLALREWLGREAPNTLKKMWFHLGGEKGFQKIAKQNNIDLTKYEEAFEGLPPEQKIPLLMDELLAHMAETNRPGLARAVKEFIGKIRRFLRSRGFLKASKLSNTELFAFLADARQVLEGQATAPYTASDDIRFNIGKEDDGRRRRVHRSRPRRGRWNPTTENPLGTLAGAPRTAWAEATSIGGKRGPIKVYRGSQESLQRRDFTEDSLGKASSNPNATLGVWFSSKKSDAEGYGNQVQEVFLDIRNPKVFKTDDVPIFESQAEASRFAEKLKQQGYDGVVFDYRDSVDDLIHAVAFEPHQVIIEETAPKPQAKPAIDPEEQKALDELQKWLDDNDDGSAPPMFSLTSPSRDAMNQFGMGEEEVASVSKVLAKLNRENLKGWYQQFKERGYEGVFDGLIGMKRAEDQAGVDDMEQSGYVAARMATGIADVMHGLLNRGAPQWKDGVIQFKQGTEGLLTVLSELGPDLNNFLAWVGAHRAEELMAQGRENNLTQADIDELKAKARGKEAKFKAVHGKYKALNSAMLGLAEEAGLIHSEGRKKWESEWYIPFYRQSEDDPMTLVGPRTKRGLSHQTAGIKKLKGSNLKTNDLLENILANWVKLTDASMKNRALALTANNLKHTNYLETLGKGDKKDAKDVIRVMENGLNNYYRVSDPALLRAVTHFQSQGFTDPVTKTGRFFKRILTTGVTASPDFILRNFIRDAVHAWAINPDGFRFGRDSAKGIKEAFENDADYWELIFAGASFQGGYVHGTDPEAAAQMIRRAVDKKGLSPNQTDQYINSLLGTNSKLFAAVNKGWQTYREWGDKIENANRLATYKAAKQNGKSVLEAAYQAKDLMDYSMRGNFQALLWFSDMLPFLNARLQGLNKLGRAAVENPKRVLREAGLMIAAFSLVLAALNDDDERYQELPDWDKDANWHVFLGDHHFRIPKPFEIGIVFGTMPERLYHNLRENQPDDRLWWSFKHNLLHTLNVNPIPQVALPWVESVANRSFFFDRPIEGMGDMNKQPGARYDERTSMTMRMLGEWLNTSPKKLEHVYNGYFGTMGSYLLGMVDVVTNAATDRPDQPSALISDLPLIKVIYRGSGPAKSTQYATDFYDRMAEVEEIYSTIRAYRREGRTDKANELLDESRNKLRYRRVLGRTRKQLGDIKVQMEKIRRNKVMSSEAKRVKLDQLTMRKNDLSRRVVRVTAAAF